MIAQKLLSCAYRTGQRFGAMHLIDVLVGRVTERVKQFGHDKLSVFGIGRELNEKQWRAALRQLVAMGHLAPDSEAFGALEADGERARRAERRDRGVAARANAGLPHSRQPEPNRGAAISRRHPRGGQGRRSDLARRAAGVALARWRASAACRPMSCCTTPPSTASRRRARRRSAKLRGIPGIGDKKLEHYGDELIALVKASRAEA